MFHRTVVGRGKHETHADTIDAVTDLFSAQCQVNSGRFENIALPLLLVAPRLPCLATFAPAVAATSAEAVDTLNLLEPLPPVPQVSTRWL